MTLLEAITALVILALSAVGFLDLFQSGGHSLRDASEWSRAVAIAESTMDEVTLGGVVATDAARPRDGERFTRTVDRRPWRGRISEIIVSVTSPRGVTFTVHRLMREGR